MAQGRIGDLLGHPLMVGAIGAMFAGYAGYVTGTTGASETNERIMRLEDQMKDVRETQRRRGAFLLCATRHVDALEGRAKPPVCDLSPE